MISQPRGSAAMLESKEMTSLESYQNQANLFVKDYLLADSFIPYTSVFGGIFACKLVFYTLVCCHSIFLMYDTQNILLICILHCLFFRSMILLSLLVLITLRPIPAYQKSNVLSGITGNWMLFPLIEIYLFFFS